MTPEVSATDIDRMADQTLLSYGENTRAKRSKFWILLTLAGVIATAGVVNDSTATVIGAMIVAPLMTPILGTAFALVLSDRHRMVRSFLIVTGGALVVIAIGFGAGLLEPLNTISEANSQISARIRPNMIDLIAALATGLVGAFALVRSDISDTLPGVAIAISLVPPLSVVGILLEEDRYSDAFGALLLFLTNVTAIVFTATMVLLLYRVRSVAADAGMEVDSLQGKTLFAVIAALVIITVPLVYSTQQVARENLAEAEMAPIAQAWADENGWKVVRMDVESDTLVIVAIGPPPQVSADVLRAALDEGGFRDIDLRVDLVVGAQQELPGVDDGPQLPRDSDDQDELVD